MKISQRGQVSPLHVMKTLTEANDFVAATNQDVVHMSLGQPGRGVPNAVVKKAQQIMDDSRLGYTEASGIRPLRERIVEHYHQTYGLSISMDRVFVTVGSSCAFFLSLLAAFEAGDRIGLIEPCYPPYRNMLKAFGMEAVLLRGSPENNFQPTRTMLDALDAPIDGLIIASPSNPTGTIISAHHHQDIIDWCAERKVRLISDEIYHGVTYGAKVQTSAAISNDAIVINSFSKYFLMPGWRLGWAVVPDHLVESFDALSQNMFVSPPSLAQYAALEVFNAKDELTAVVEDYRHNRDKLLAAMPSMGFSNLASADGAFYIYADVSKLTNDSEQFCKDMLTNARVVAVPGIDFDTEQGRRYTRFSYCGTSQDIDIAIERLGSWLR